MSTIQIVCLVLTWVMAVFVLVMTLSARRDLRAANRMRAACIQAIHDLAGDVEDLAPGRGHQICIAILARLDHEGHFRI